MVDIVSKETRSQMMSGIRGKDTKPELVLRAGLHKRGFRFRLHYGGLPGKPDLVFPRYNAIVLVNGCFWHAHDCHLFKWPRSREDFWKEKISSNKVRDSNNLAVYQARGWRTLIVWECALKGKKRYSAEVIVGLVEKWLKSGCGDDQIEGSK